MKTFFLIILLLCFHSFAEDEAPLPLDPAYMGTHGMALLSYSSTIYASHLPLYQKPHNVQLLYKLSVKDLHLIQLVRDAELVTIKPKKFNLQRLMRGEKMVVTADIYMGHFERDGMVVYENMELSFDKQLYVRELKDLPKASKNQEYDVVQLRKNKRIYIHRITQAPSYDHIIHIDLEAGCLSTFFTSILVPKQPELLYKFLNCGTMKPLYYESKDFENAPI